MPPGRHETRKWLVVGLAFVFAWVAFLAIWGPRVPGMEPDPPTLKGTGLAAPADFSWTVRDLDDAPVDFARFQGRPILLNLWATWCGPCLEEIPSLARLAADPRIKAKGVAVVCVSTDESPEALRRFVRGKPWEMTVLRATSLPPIFLTDGLPSTFLISPAGRVVATQDGPARWDDPSVISFLEQMAAMPR